MEICFSIDIGSESTKSAYAYKNGGSAVYKDALLIDGTDFPSFAYCMTPADVGQSSGGFGTDEWKFGKEAIYEAAKDSNFRYLVRIGDLLKLFTDPKVKVYYDKRSLFKNFYFPPKINDDEAYGAESLKNEELIRKKYFTAKFGDTPRDVCRKFLTAYCKKLIEEMEKTLNAKGISALSLSYKWVLVYPSNAQLEYIEELMTLLKQATQSKEDPKLISVTKAVGAALLEYGLIKRPTQSGVAKKTLIFNVGDEKTSVTNVHFRKDNIYTYRLKADKEGKNANFMCNEPLAVGGKDFDILINDMLSRESDKIPSFGSGGDQSSEKGTYAAQFMTMQDIKYGKALFSEDAYYATVADNGIEFIYAREMKLHIPIKREKFLARAQEEVFKKIWDYVSEKLSLTCAADVDTVIFAGGGAETYGLEEYLTKQLKIKFGGRNIKYVDFSPEGKAVCKPAYAAAIGAALFGIGAYKFTIITTKAYATKAQYKNDPRVYCKIIIPQQETIPLTGKLEERTEKVTLGGFTPNQFNEKTKQYEMFDIFFKLNSAGEKDDMIPYEENEINCNIKSQNTVVVFKRRNGSGLQGELKYDFQRQIYYFNKKEDNSSAALICDEGFNIDCEGRGKFFVKNRTTIPSYKDIEVSIDGEMELD